MATRTKLTYEDYEAFPDDGNRYEIIDGEVCVSAATDHRASMGERANSYGLLGNHVEAADLGRRLLCALRGYAQPT